MEHVRLGRSDLSVSPIAFGTWELSGYWGETDSKTAIGAVHRAVELGVNLFDSARAYGFGAAEEFLARALNSLPRDKLIIATKGGIRQQGHGVARDSSPSFIREGVEASLEALNTDYIDLYQVHWPDPKVPFEETGAALLALVEAGKIRHFGVSNFTPDEMEVFSATVPIETMQPPYHMFRRDIESTILPYAIARDIGVLVYSPLAHGLLSGQLSERFDIHDWRATNELFQGEDYRRNLQVVAELQNLAHTELGVTVAQLALAWTLSHPGVQVAIIGTRNLGHVEDSVNAAEMKLSSDMLQAIDLILTRAVPIGGLAPETY
jgi:aryl-alcohol dehydrogenase-like predicted oxidoreductase